MRLCPRHGHMDIFGIISMDVDLYVGICYLEGQVQGTATFSVSVSIAFFSESFSLQAHYGFGGSQNTNDALLEPRPGRAEAFLIEPAGMERRPLVYDDTSPQEAPVGYCRDENNPPQFVDQTTWTAYYNSFVQG